MKDKVLGLVGVCFLIIASLPSFVLAAELLEVNPIVTGSSVAIEVTADIPMTYTYYKVPGQARAVVDIADADPEKVEPLIVVNTGALSSISVDKTIIADMTVSRLVFNLVSESDISVKHSADRKKLTVSFGSGKSVSVVEPQPAAPPVIVAAPVAEPEPILKKVEAVTVAPATPVNPLITEEEDPLGLDEPQPAVAPEPAPAVARSVKLEPVVPATSNSQPLSKSVVKGVVIGSSYIDIQVNGNVDKIKHIKLTQPDRLAIDIPGTSTMTKKTITVNKFGIAKVRIGVSPGVVRIVLDGSRPPFPGYSVDFTDSGVRINFK